MDNTIANPGRGTLALLLAVEQVLLGAPLACPPPDTRHTWDAFILGSRVRVYAPHPFYGHPSLACEFVGGTEPMEAARVTREAVAKWRIDRASIRARLYLDRIESSRVSA